MIYNKGFRVARFVTDLLFTVCIEANLGLSLFIYLKCYHVFKGEKKSWHDSKLVRIAEDRALFSYTEQGVLIHWFWHSVMCDVDRRSCLYYTQDLHQR